MVGGGLVGLTATLALAHSPAFQNREIVVVSPPTSRADDRTTALLMPTVRFLDQLGVFETCRASSAPLAVMRIVDGTQRLLRAPRTEFKAMEIGEDAFGYNVVRN